MFTGAWGLVLGASLQIVVTPKFSGEPLQPNSLRYETSAKETFSITRVSYLVSGFALQRADGSWLELTNQLAWFDLEKSHSSHRVASVPSGEYRALRFHIGPDEKLNHADVAQFPADHPLNPNLNGLHWSWQGGYIFLAIEGMWRSAAVPAAALTNAEPSSEHFNAPAKADVLRPGVPRSGAALDGWSYHLARDTNRTRINLAVPLDLTHDTKLELDFDLATLLNAPRPLSFAKAGSSTHSREGDPIAAALVANLPGAFHVRRVSAATASEIVAENLKPLYLPEKFTPYRFQMSATFPIPDLPRDNPLIEERVALGEKLFRETALSKDGSLSCSSCHDSKHAFSDPRRYSIGVREQVGTRQAMPLFNLAWKNSFFWDGRAPSLRAQALMPIQDHTEMDETLTNVCAKLAGQSTISNRQSAINYTALFTSAFGSSEITPEKIGFAIESFVLTLTSFDSKFDRALRGETQLSDEENRGFELFMTEFDPRREQFGADCFHCHGGPLFQSQTFANNGLDATFTDPGRAKISGKDSDNGKFSTPSLRNVTLTAPYMHDGRFTTLEEVVDHYSTGVTRSATLDPNIAKHPDGGVPLSAVDKRALVAFLKTLADEKFTPPGGGERTAK
ncbi:MAG: cytochrome C peroxidase [Pedosphaera sp.]|nr:cytochrome C peroxidase [Pedosphaera sp.]